MYFIIYHNCDVTSPLIKCLKIMTHNNDIFAYSETDGWLVTYPDEPYYPDNILQFVLNKDNTYPDFICIRIDEIGFNSISKKAEYYIDTLLFILNKYVSSKRYELSYSSKEKETLAYITEKEHIFSKIHT